MRAHRNSNQILHCDQNISEENSYIPPALAKTFLTGMLMRDLFAVANLIVFCPDVLLTYAVR